VTPSSLVVRSVEAHDDETHGTNLVESPGSPLPLSAVCWLQLPSFGIVCNSVHQALTIRALRPTLVSRPNCIPFLNLVVAVTSLLHMTCCGRTSISLLCSKATRSASDERTGLHHHLRRCAVDILLEAWSDISQSASRGFRWRLTAFGRGSKRALPAHDMVSCCCPLLDWEGLREETKR
jgi:hypothetical protein